MPAPRKTQRSWIQKNPKKVLFCFLLVAILVLDLSLTGIYHFFKYGTIHKYADRRALGERSPIFHHTLKPNTRFSYQRWGHTRHSVFTNSLGFRDTAVRSVPLSSDKVRVLIMGDSFVYGVGLPYDKTFVSLVASGLADRNVEVLNAGVVSYSPAIYLKKTEYLLRDVGLRFDHLVVFLDISDIHDEAAFYDTTDEGVIWIGGPAPAIREFLYEYTTLPRNLWEAGEALYKWIADDPDTHRTEEDRRYGTNEYRSLWTIDKEAYEDYGALGMERAKKHMGRLHDLLQAHGIDMTLVVYPWPTQVMHTDLDSIQVRLWKAWAAKRSVRFVDLFPDFIQAGTDPREAISKYFIPGDIHWSEEGHRLVAATLRDTWTGHLDHPTDDGHT